MFTIIVLLVVFSLVSWIWSGWKKIPIGWKGLKTFLGKRTHTKVNEGWQLAPWPQGIEAEDCRQAVIKLEPLEAITKDNIKVTIDGSIVRTITDLFKFLDVNPKEIRQGLDDIWDEIIRRQVRKKELKDALEMHVTLGEYAKKHIHKHSNLNWGIGIVRVMIAGITPTDTKVIEDLELGKREELQRVGQQVQAAHFGALVNFFAGDSPLEIENDVTPGPKTPGPKLSPELAYEAALIHIDKTTPKDISSKTFGLDPATVTAIVNAVMGRK